MQNTEIFNNPLIDHKLTILKDKTSSNAQFRKALREISSLMVLNVFADLKTRPKTIQTPFLRENAPTIAENIILVPILRAGLGMLEAFDQLLPNSKLGFAGFQRGKDLRITKYHFSLPKVTPNSQIVILDPMIATGNTAIAAIDEIKKHVNFTIPIKLVGILGTEIGLKKIHHQHKNVKIFLAKSLEKLNQKSYIIPGLGDASDRLFGTE